MRLWTLLVLQGGIGIVALIAACSNSSDDSASADTSDTTETTVVTDAEFEATDWTEATHRNNVDPNHAEVYKAQYDDYLLEIIGGAFETSTTQMLYDTYAHLVEPYATTEIAGYSFLNGANDFYNAVSVLKSDAGSRAAVVFTMPGCASSKPGPQEPINQFDLNNDGFLTREEYSASSLSDVMEFDALGNDGDGLLSRRELEFRADRKCGSRGSKPSLS